MGTNTLNTRTDLQTIVASWFNDIKTLLSVDFVPRNISGVPSDMAGSLGSTTCRWKEGHFSDSVYVGGVDISQIESEPKHPHRIVSGKAKTSGAPNFIAAGSGLTVDLDAAATDLVCYIDDIKYTFQDFLTFSGLTAAPSTNNTCLINDPSLQGQGFTRYIGEWDDEYLTIDTIGSEITALDGQIAAFKTSNEVLLCHVDTTNNRLKPIFRNFAGTFDPLYDNTTLTLLKLNTLLLKSDGIVKVVSTYYPESVDVSPAAGTAGKIYIERDTGRIGYDDGAVISYDYIILGFGICSSSVCSYVRAYDFDLSCQDSIDITMRIKDASTITIKSGSFANVNGYNISSYADIDVTTSSDMASGETIAANSVYYIYITDAGEFYFSIKPPRRQAWPFKGFYHVSEYWRCVGEFETNGSSEVVKLSGGCLSLHFGASSTKSGDLSSDDQYISGHKFFNDTVSSKGRCLTHINDGVKSDGTFYGHHTIVKSIAATGVARMAYCPIEHKIYALSDGYSPTYVRVIDCNTNAVVSIVTFAGQLYDIAYAPAVHEMYYADYGNGVVYVYDCDTNTVLATNTLGSSGKPNILVYEPKNNRMWCRDSQNYWLTIFDCNTRAVLSTTSYIDMTDGAYCPYDNTMYVTQFSSGSGGKFAIVDCDNLNVLKTTNTSYSGYAYNPTNKTMYIADGSNDRVAIFDVINRVILGYISVGDSPRQMAWNKRNNQLYVMCTNGGVMNVIDCDTNTAVKTLTLTTYAYDVEVDGRDGLIYAATSSGYVYVIKST